MLVVSMPEIVSALCLARMTVAIDTQRQILTALALLSIAQAPIQLCADLM